MADKNTKDENYFKAIKELRKRDMNLSDTNIDKALSGELGSDSTLEGTLSDEKELLPTEEMDDLDLLETAMQEVSEKAAKQGIGKGMETMTSSLEEGGMDLSTMPGDITNQIISFAQQQTVSPIESEMKTMSNLVEGLRTQRQRERQAARNNLTTMINTGAIANSDDETLQNLANTLPEMELPQLQNIKNAVSANQSANDTVKDSIAEDIDEKADMFEQSANPEQAKKQYKQSLIDRYGKEYSNYIDSQLEGRTLDGSGGVKDAYSKAKQFIEDNPNASRTELELGLSQMNERKDLGLSGQIDDLVEEFKGRDTEADRFLTDQQLESVGKNLVTSYGDVETAKRAVEQGTIKLKLEEGEDPEDVQLSSDQINKVKKSIDKQFPEGYTDEVKDRMNTAWYELGEQDWGKKLRNSAGWAGGPAGKGIQELIE